VIGMLRTLPLDPVTESIWDDRELLELLSQRSLGDVFRPVLGNRPAPIAARVLLPRGCQAKALSSASDEVLRSLLIDDVAAAALRRGDRDAFVQRRSLALTRRLQALVDLKAAPGESDRPPLSVVSSG